MTDYPTTFPRIFFLFFYFHSHHSKGETGPLNSISRATSPNHEISEMPFIPFKVSTLFPQAISRSPWGSVIVSSQTNPLSEQEAPPAPLPSCSDLLPWSHSWARSCSCWKSLPRKVWASVLACGTTRLRWLCIRLLLKLWVMDTAKNKKCRPRLSLQLESWWERCARARGVSHTQRPRGHDARFNVIQDASDFQWL